MSAPLDPPTAVAPRLWPSAAWGWFAVAARSCEDAADTANAVFYGYAEVANDNSHYWRGDHPLCVEYPGPYGFLSTGAETCEPHQRLRDFVRLHADDFGVYTWTLDPR